LLFGVGIVQVNVFVDTQFASYMGEGAMASINFADRIMELVLGGYAVALSTAILPLLSRQAAEMRLVEMRSTLNFAIRVILFVTLPATVGLVLLRTPIVQVLFEHGEFDVASTALTAKPLIFFALGLSMFSLMKIIVPAFYALHDTRTPVLIAFVAMLLNIVFNFMFFRPLHNGGPPLATSLSAAFSSIALIVVFRRRHGSLGLRRIASSLAKFAVASATMAAVAYLLIHIPGFYTGQFFQKAMALLISIVLATVTYFGTAYALRAREFAEMGGIIFGRVRQ
jgi:putative peptidoglycan lipid II flippase